MVRWKFIADDEDGKLWMQNPSQLQIFVDFQSGDGSANGEWRRIMVVTRSWVEEHLPTVRLGSGGSGWAVFPAMLVVHDASPRGMNDAIEAALATGGIDHFASPIAANTP